MNRTYRPLLSAVLLLVAAAGCRQSPAERKARFLANGKQLLERKDYGRALLEFRNAEQARPGDPDVYCLMAKAYLAQEDWDRAVVCLRKATELDPRHVEAQLRLAELMSSASDVEVLAEAYRRLSTLAKDHPDALTALALTEWKLSRKEEAERHLRSAFERLPHDLNAAVALAQVLVARSDFAGAERVLVQSAASPRSTADVTVALGEFYSLRNRLPEAEAQFRRAAMLEPQNPRALTDLAALLLISARREEAEELYRRISALPDGRYRAVWGLYLLQNGRTEAARLEFERLAKADPDNREARGGLVSSMVALNRSDDAERLLGEALRRNPRDADALYQRGALHLMRGRLPSAEADLNQVLQFRPDLAEAHYLLSRVSFARRSSAAQKQQLDEVLRLNPEFLAARLDLAGVLLAGGSGKLALEVIDAAPESLRGNFDLGVQRNWALLAAGRTGEARSGIADSLRSGRKSADLLLQDAGLKMTDHRFSDAAAAAREALRLSPEDVRALDLLFRSFAARNQTAEGIRELRAHASQHPALAPVHYYLGQALFATGDKLGSRVAFEAAERADGGYPLARLSLAKFDAEEGNYSAARGRLQALLSRQPGNSVALLWTGHLDQLAGDSNAAIASYRKALEVDPNNADALNNLAYLLSESAKRPDEALPFAERAKELNPNSPAIDNTLGWILYRKGLYSMSVKYLEKAVTAESTPRRLCHLAMAYSRLGDRKRGWERLELALRKDPNIPEAQEARGVVGEPAREIR